VTYLFPALLTVGLPLIAIPLVIHLIHLRRRRRIPWAAMEFLLESQKKNKKWIVLKQLLLLALRTLAIAAIVLMLAGPVVQSAWAALFGGGVTHHLILLDDSYSMGDVQNDTPIQQEANRVALQIIRTAVGRGDRQLVTLLPFSVAQRLAAGAGPPIDRAPLTTELVAQLQGTLARLATSQETAGPLDALQAAGRLPKPPADETRIAYLISDFRETNWRETEPLRQSALELQRHCRQLQLVGCADQTRANLAITRLEPQQGVRAAGIETWMEVTLANYGNTPSAPLTVELKHNGAALPAVSFDEIDAGEEATRQFRVSFSAAGSRLEATIPDDALPVDNVRYFAVQPPAAYPILLIDDSPRNQDSRFLATALDPGGQNLAGWTPQVERVEFLRRGEDLSRFAAICLLDVGRLEEQELANLKSYAESGGGVAIFTGPQVQRDFYNGPFNDAGAGLFPLRIGTPSQLLRDADPSEPDVVVGNSPLLRVFQGQRNSFLGLVKVDFYHAVDPQWQAADGQQVEVLARLRNRAPWIVRQKYGAGTVIAQLSKLSPDRTDLGAWTNWSLNPAFPVFANELVGTLSAARRSFEARVVGEPLDLTFAEAQFLPTVQIVPPAGTGRPPYAAEATLDQGELKLDTPTDFTSGIWQFDLSPREPEAATQPANTLVAVNLSVGEGDLHRLGGGELETRLEGIDFQYVRSSQFNQRPEELAGYNLSQILLALLIAALVAEQVVAYSAGYHAAQDRRLSTERRHATQWGAR
jgi:hypothetical protein